MASILVVDDEPSMLSFIAKAMRRDGYLVVEAATLTEAKQICSSTNFDLVITDGLLPDGNGARWAEELTRDNQPVLLASASETADIPSLAKPFNMTQLQAKVRELLGENNCA